MGWGGVVSAKPAWLSEQEMGLGVIKSDMGVFMEYGKIKKSFMLWNLLNNVAIITMLNVMTSGQEAPDDGDWTTLYFLPGDKTTLPSQHLFRFNRV